MIRWIVAIFAYGLTQGAYAQIPVRQAASVGLEQKQSFVRGLIEDASLEKRVLASQDAEGQRLLASAKSSYAGALTALDAGDFAAAEKLFGEALSTIGKVRRRIPDVAGISAGQRAEYERLLETVLLLQKSYLGYLERGKLAPIEEAGGRGNLSVAKLIESAKVHAAEGRAGPAVRALEAAEQVMKSGIGRILGAALLEYDQKFDRPAEELAYELERNRSHLELISVAISELKPAADIRTMMDDMVEQNRTALAQSNKFARTKDYEEALSSVRVGIGYLRNALIAAGLVLPQPASE